MTSSSADDSTDGYTSDFSGSSWAWTSALWNVHCFAQKVPKVSCEDHNGACVWLRWFAATVSKSPAEHFVSAEKDPLCP